MKPVRSIGMGLLTGGAITLGILGGTSQSANAAVASNSMPAAKSVVKSAHEHEGKAKAKAARHHHGGIGGYGNGCCPTPTVAYSTPCNTSYSTAYNTAYNTSYQAYNACPTTFSTTSVAMRPYVVHRTSLRPYVTTQVVNRPVLVRSLAYQPVDTSYVAVRPTLVRHTFSEVSQTVEQCASAVETCATECVTSYPC